MDLTQVTRGSDGVFVCRECGFRYALTPTEISRTCAATVGQVRDAALAVPVAVRSRRVARAVWSPNAYCAHLADATELIEHRVRRIATEDRPLLPGYDQDRAAEEGSFDSVPMDSSLPRIEAAVARFVELIDELPPAAWELVGMHEEAGEVLLGELAHDMPHELRHHTGDLRKLREQLGG